STVPARDDRNGKVKGYNSVNRKYKRGGKSGQDHISLLVIPPVAEAASPSQSGNAVRDFSHSALGFVAQRSKIGDQSHVPEKKRNRKISTHGKYVPQKRAAEIRPDSHLVGDRKHPVDHPNTSYVDGRENTGTHHGKDGHSLGKTINGRSPALAKKKKNCRNQRTG